MKEIQKTYDIKLDSKKRFTIRNPKYEYYHVIEMEDGRIILEPRELVEPFTISKSTLEAMDKDMENLKNGIISGPIVINGKRKRAK